MNLDCAPTVSPSGAGKRAAAVLTDGAARTLSERDFPFGQCAKCGTARTSYKSKTDVRGFRTHCPKCNADKSRAHRKKNPGQFYEYFKQWKAAHPQKHAAHLAFDRAMAAGSIERRPCEQCGEVKLVHAHHDDYSRPLDVIWLCPKHHRERHRELAAKVSANAA